jgi:hypothetical protein
MGHPRSELSSDLGHAAHTAGDMNAYSTEVY